MKVFSKLATTRGQSKGLVAIIPLILVSMQLWAAPTEDMHGHLTANEPCISLDLKCASKANAVFAEDGRLYLVWTSNGHVMFGESSDLGKTIINSVEIANQNEHLDSGPDARPQLLIDKDGKIFIAYSYFKDSHWNAEISYVTSANSGKTFSHPKLLVNSGISERFPTMTLGSDGVIHAAWIDKRLVNADRVNGKVRLGASIAYATSPDWGENFSTPQIIQESSCECCRIAITIDKNNNPVIAYRAIFAGVRDHAVQVLDHSTTSQNIYRVSDDGWKTDVCPHHGPTLAISKDTTIHVAWYTQGANRQGVFYSNTGRNGKIFSAPRKLTYGIGSSSRPYLLAQNDQVWLVWKEFDGSQATIIGQFSADNGATWTDPKPLASSSGYTDHPILLSNKDHVYVSWLTRENGYQLIRLD